MTKKQKREYYMAVIKSNLGWRFKEFKGVTFEEIEAKFAEVWKQVEDFIPIGSKEETERLKRKGLNLEKEQVKKQKSSEEALEIETSTEEFTKEKIKEMMQLVLVEDVYVQALQVKQPIIDWKVHTEGQRSYWQIIRLEGSSACYQFFIDLLKHLDREDLNQLWALVKEYLSIRPATNDKEMELWVELKRMYEPDPEDQLWTLTQNFMHAQVEWKLYDLSRVHHLTAKDGEIFMLVEKDYPLRKGLTLVMISYKLQVENYSQMVEDLIRKIYNIANTLRQQEEKRCHCQKFALLLKRRRRNCQSKIDGSYTKIVPHVLPMILAVTKNTFDDDVEEAPLQDLALNEDNVFQPNQCDAFDSDFDGAPTTHTKFMANLSFDDLIYDEASLSYDSNILSKVQDHDNYLDSIGEYHEESNYDQLYTYLKQHEAHANENKMMLERYNQHAIDPLTLVSNVSPHQGVVAAWNARVHNKVDNAKKGQARQIKCCTCNETWHIARNCTQPKRPQNSEYFKDKMLLMQAQVNGAVLYEKHLLFIAGGQKNTFDDDVEEAPLQDLGRYLSFTKSIFWRGGQKNTFDDDVEEAPLQDLALNEDNVFQPD
nr:hypothetical protein [Tanacetum cinerariifolium]